MAPSDGKRVTIKMSQDLADRLAHAQALTTEKSFAAFLRALVELGLPLFRDQLSRSFLPNDSYEHRGKQVPHPRWPASTVMQEIAALVDAQHYHPDTDPDRTLDADGRAAEVARAAEAAQRALELRDLVTLCEERGPGKVKKWLEGKARDNPGYRRKLEAELDAWAAQRGAGGEPEEDLLERHSRDAVMKEASEEIAKL